MKEETKWSESIHTSSLLHLLFTYNKRGKNPQKKNGFNQDQKNLAHFLANQVSYSSNKLHSLKESTL